MVDKPKSVMISHSPKHDVEEPSNHNLASVSRIQNMGWIILGILFMYFLFVLSTVVDHVYNLRHHGNHMSVKDNPYGYTDRMELEMYQHNPEVIEGLEYNIYEIQIQEDDYYSQILRHSLFEPNEEFRRVSEFQLSNNAINHADGISVNIFYDTSSGKESLYMSCSNLAECDENHDGWLGYYNSRDEFYFCNCGSYYDNSIMVAVSDDMDPYSIYVYLDYHHDSMFSGFLFTIVFTLGLIAGKIIAKRIESPYFIRTIVPVYAISIIVKTISMF